MIVHGDNLEAQQCLENFRDFVFSPADLSISTQEFNNNLSFEILPNPVLSDQVRFEVDSKFSDVPYQVTIFSLDGSVQQQYKDIRDDQVLEISSLPAGLYLVRLIQENQQVATKRIIKQ